MGSNSKAKSIPGVRENQRQVSARSESHMAKSTSKSVSSPSSLKSQNHQNNVHQSSYCHQHTVLSSNVARSSSKNNLQTKFVKRHHTAASSCSGPADFIIQKSIV